MECVYFLPIYVQVRRGGYKVHKADPIFPLQLAALLTINQLLTDYQSINNIFLQAFIFNSLEWKTKIVVPQAADYP